MYDISSKVFLSKLTCGRKNRLRWWSFKFYFAEIITKSERMYAYLKMNEFSQNEICPKFV